MKCCSGVKLSNSDTAGLDLELKAACAAWENTCVKQVLDTSARLTHSYVKVLRAESNLTVKKNAASLLAKGLNAA